MSEEKVVTATQTIQEAFASVILDAVETVGEAKNFLLSELPEVAEQALLFYGVKSFIIFVLCLTVPLLWTLVVYKFRGSKGHPGFIFDKDGDVDFPQFVVCCGTVILYIVACVHINLEWLKIYLAPKIWLIEYAGSLVK